MALQFKPKIYNTMILISVAKVEKQRANKTRKATLNGIHFAAQPASNNIKK